MDLLLLFVDSVVLSRIQSVINQDHPSMKSSLHVRLDLRSNAMLPPPIALRSLINSGTFFVHEVKTVYLYTYQCFLEGLGMPRTSINPLFGMPGNSGVRESSFENP